MRLNVLSICILLFLLPIDLIAQTTFTDVTAISGTGLGETTTRGVSWVDFNNDGYPDLFLPTAGNVPNKLYRNNGNGMFSEIAAAVGLNDLTNTITCSWADFDNDGDLDLLTTATAAGTKLWRNNHAPGDSSFTDITASAGITMTGAQMPAWADYNRDGLLDFYSSISNSSTSSDALYRNNGNASFTNVADSAGVNHQVSGVLEQAVTWGDYNKDGFPDLFIGNLQTAGPSFFHRNNGNGTFTEIAATLGFQGAARGAQWVDYNNDGLWDMSIAGYAGGTTPVPVKLFRNNGDGTFSDVAASAGITEPVISWGVTWADYDNNGYEDMFVNVFGQSTSCILYKNNGNGTFTNATAEAGLTNLTKLSSCWGDYDRDGDMDLYAVGSGSSGNHLFRNNCDTTNKWIEIKLLASRAENNRLGVGAQIEVRSGTLKMMREITTAVGYRSQNMLTAHFGLGTNARVDTVIIRWPSRAITVYTNLAARQIIQLREIPPLAVAEEGAPRTFLLEQNYPNPFNPTTTITYQLPLGGSQFVSLKVFDVLGREVATLVEELQAPGFKSVEFTASNLSSGVYFYRLQAGHNMNTKKLVVAR